MKKVKYALLLTLIIILNIVIFFRITIVPTNFEIKTTITAAKSGVVKLFYSKTNEWFNDSFQTQRYNIVDKKVNLTFFIPNDVNRIKLELGDNSKYIKLNDITLRYLWKNYNLDKNSISPDKFVYSFKNEYIAEMNQRFVVLNYILKILICIVLDLIFYIVFRKSKSVLTLVLDLSSNKNLIFNLAKNDFRTKYAGSYLGITWAFVQPIVTILVYWFVFEVGLKSSSPIKGTPFILWFSIGLIPWFFFSEALVNATNSMVEYSFLVKKIVFKISILPIVKILSSFFVHLIFIIFIACIYLLYGGTLSLQMLQLPYYIFCTFFLVLSISYITSAIVVFFKDLGQIISISLQVGMWMTPIMWSFNIIPNKYQWIIKLNPIFYIVQGYRDAFLYRMWFWDKYFQTVYFWAFTIVLFIIGSIIFKKLKPHFADVL